MYNPEELAVYIHWPYCKSKCPYCDFYKQLAHNVEQGKIVAEYLEALRKYHELLPNRKIKSVFFGGGTPSLLEPRYVAQIIDEISGLWPMLDNAEISLEANPNSRFQTMFADLKNAGVNRLSLGVQALNEADLRFLGRTHNLQTARLCLQEVVQTFANHSADLIYARPRQNLAEWETELKEITAYGLRHLSLYQLTIEENTVFARKGVQALDDDKAAEMYDFTRDFLDSHGYPQYEVSNFAPDGFASVHNLTYWQGGDYIGIGQSAHGRLHLGDKMLATVYPFVDEELTPQERAEELLLMGLRLTQGINKSDFKQICGLDLSDIINKEKAKQLQELQLVEETAEVLRVTYKGFPLLNKIIEELCV